MKRTPSVRMPDPRAGVIRSEHPRDVGANGLVESYNWVLRDGNVQVRDGITPVAAPGLTLITPGSSWSAQGGNIYKSILSGIVTDVYFDGVKGNRVANVGSLAAEYDWVYAINALYVYAPGDPDTEYTDPGVQWSAGTGSSSVVALISHDYQGQDDSGDQGVVRDQLIAVTDSSIMCYNNDLSVVREATETDTDWAWQGFVGQSPTDSTVPWEISQKISVDWSNIDWSVLETAHTGDIHGAAIVCEFTFLSPAGITLYLHTFDDSSTKNISTAVWNKDTDSDIIGYSEYESGYPWQIKTQSGGVAPAYETGIYVIFSDTWDSWYDELNASGGSPGSGSVKFVWSVYQAENHGLPGGQLVTDLDRTTRPVSRTWDFEQTTHTLIAAKDNYILDVDTDSLGAVPDPTVSVAGDAGVSPRARCIGIASQRVVAGNISYFDTEATMDENEIDYNLDYAGSNPSGNDCEWHNVVDQFATFPDAVVYSGTVLTGGHTYWYPGDILRLADTPGEIVAVQEMGTQQIAVYKTDAIYTLTAQSGISPFAPSLRASGIQGPVGPRAVVALNDQTHLYLGRDGGVYMFTGASPQSLGDQFRSWIAREMDPEYYADDSFMQFDPEKNEVHVYYPVKGSGGVVRKGMIIDVSSQPFTGWPVLWPHKIYSGITLDEINFICACMHWEGGQSVATGDITIPASEVVASPTTKYQELYFGTEHDPLADPRTNIDDGRIFKTIQNGNDYGVPIEAGMESGISDLGDPDSQKVLLELELLIDNISDVPGGDSAELDVTIYGGDSNQNLSQLFQETGISIASGQITVHPRVRARYFSYEITVTCPIDPFTGATNLWTENYGEIRFYGAIARFKRSGVRQN